ncbi:glycoside hydrolase family 16 protein [Mycolicibacterium pyrenivorans]|uniref:glycoside hydrolase family 16 protein n=1 Tax=Mycolicibacterium pyrenivorans TaxID=187102 RepID=UPI0021F3240C|nr:glycoside hydrolase family 16 protein [Mycolicibacterium pyrenivorans]
MVNSRRSGTRGTGSKGWLAGGVVAAGLGAAVIVGAATAGASPGDADTGSSTSTNPNTAESVRSSQTSSTSAGPEPDSQDDSADTEVGETAQLPDDAEDDADSSDDAEDDTDSSDDTDSGGEVAVRGEDADVPAADEPEVPVTTADSDTDAPRAGDDDDMVEKSPEPISAKPQRSVEQATAAVTLRTTTAVTATVETDPVLIAAATSTDVTVGSMVVDWLYSIGIRSNKMGTDFLNIPVSKYTAARWLVKRARIYRDVVIPQPSDPSGPSAPGQGPLLWETNFTDLNEALTYWGLQTGRWGQSAGENQYYTDGDNVYVDAQGNLVIEARRDATPDGLGTPDNYTSARVVTFGKQSIGVGTRVVARIQMPVTQGTLPAFWSVGLEPGHEYDWPRQGEIDIVEIPGMGTPASRRWWTGNIHGPAAADNTVDVKLHGVDADLGVDVSQGFHEYGMDWYADRIVWHVDGVEVGRVTKAQYEALGGDWTPFSGAWEHYLILNVAVGNPWTGDPSPSAPFEAQMKVDWVKAYAL